MLANMLVMGKGMQKRYTRMSGFKSAIAGGSFLDAAWDGDDVISAARSSRIQGDFGNVKRSDQCLSSPLQVADLVGFLMLG